MLTVSNVLFNVSEGAEVSGVGIAVTRNDGLTSSSENLDGAAPPPAAARVYIDQCEFQGLSVGVHGEGGIFTLTNSVFINGTRGFWFQLPLDDAGKGRAPFVATHNVFQGLTDEPARIEGGNAYVFIDNECMPGQKWSTFVCDGNLPACVVDSNVDCNISKQ